MGPYSGTATSPELRGLGLKIRMLCILDHSVPQGDIQVGLGGSVNARQVIEGSEPICWNNSFDSLIDSYVTGPSILCGVRPIVILRVNHSGLS